MSEKTQSRRGLLQVPCVCVAEPGSKARSAGLTRPCPPHAVLSTQDSLAFCGSLFLLETRGAMFISLAGMVRSLSCSETLIKSLIVCGTEESTE